MTLSTAELARFLGKTAKTINAWVGEGLPVQKRAAVGEKNVFDSAACVQWLIDRALGKAGSVHAQLATKRLEEIELNLAERRGKLIRQEFIEPLIAGIVVELREAILNTPDYAQARHWMVDFEATEGLRAHLSRILSDASKRGDKVVAKFDKAGGKKRGPDPVPGDDDVDADEGEQGDRVVKTLVKGMLDGLSTGKEMNLVGLPELVRIEDVEEAREIVAGVVRKTFAPLPEQLRAGGLPLNDEQADWLRDELERIVAPLDAPLDYSLLRDWLH